MPHRQIQDNLIMVHEIMQTLKRKSGRGGLLVVKIDMEKGYDKVSWPFLMAVMKCFDFCDQWRKWIYQYISTVSFSVLINGAPFDFFRPSCGLQQGEPLSPFLFVLVTEVLTCIIQRDADKGLIHGIKIARTAPLLLTFFLLMM